MGTSHTFEESMSWQSCERVLEGCRAVGDGQALSMVRYYSFISKYAAQLHEQAYKESKAVEDERMFEVRLEHRLYSRRPVRRVTSHDLRIHHTNSLHSDIYIYIYTYTTYAVWESITLAHPDKWQMQITRHSKAANETSRYRNWGQMCGYYKLIQRRLYIPPHLVNRLRRLLPEVKPCDGAHDSRRSRSGLYL